MRKRFVLLGAITLYVLSLTAWLSSKNPMGLDEFFAWNLLSDPSFTHAVGSWSRGADSGGFLYYALLWPLVRLTHGSVLAVRLFSATCFLLAGITWWRALSRWMAPRSAALGIGLVWFSNGFLLSYIAQVRFYTPLVLFAALATLATLQALEAERTSRRDLIFVFAAHACLVLIHMLGTVYSALLVAASLLSERPRTRSLTVAAAGLSSWLLLLPCRTAIRTGSTNATSLVQPGLYDLLRYYLHWSASLPVLLVAFGGLVWLLRDLHRGAKGTGIASETRRESAALCLAFLPAPLCLFLLCLLVRPLGALRYLLPYALCLCTLCAYGMTRLQRREGGRYAGSIALACLLLTAVLHVRALRTLPVGPALDVGRLPALAQGKPIVVADEQTFFRLQYYRSTPGLQFRFLLPPHNKPPSGIMATIAARGYFPNSFQHVDTFEQAHPDFLFISPARLGPSLPFVHIPGCHVQMVGSIALSEERQPVYQAVNCRSL